MRFRAPDAATTVVWQLNGLSTYLEDPV